MILNETKTVYLTIDGYYSGPAGLSANSEIAFAPGGAGARSGRHDATIDGERVTLMLDRSRYKKAHPFIYGRAI